METGIFFVYVLFSMNLFDQSYDAPETTRLLTRGVCKMFQDLGFGTLTEFKLANGRRVDVMAIDTCRPVRSNASWKVYALK